jgi:[ribosomal protein S5]-alanine N-acetyltransferase
MDNIILNTERMVLRQFDLEDADFIIQLLNDPGWLKYIGHRNIHTLEAARSYLQDKLMKSYAEHGFGLSHVSLRETGESIGMCGILKRDSLEHPDIGFAFLEPHAGKGYGYEMATAVLRHARETLNIHTVQAIVVDYNPASIRLLEKIGMAMQKRVRLSEDSEELLLYQTV